MEILGRRYGALLTRQSERDKPRSVFGNGLFADTKKTAREQAGVCLCLLLAMASDAGRTILLRDRGIHPRFLAKQIRMFELSLQLERWFKMESYPYHHAADEVRMGNQIDGFVSLCAETCSRKGNGANLIKNHLLLHFPRLISMFGPPAGWDSAPVEGFHKLFSKLPGGLTQRVYKVFQKQVADRTSEIDVVNTVCQHIQDHGERYNPPTEQFKVGPAGSHFEVYCHDGVGKMTWREQANKTKETHCQFLLDFVCSEVLSHTNVDRVSGFTEFKTLFEGRTRPTIFRAHPSYDSNTGQHTHTWYDWSMFHSTEGGPVPGRILMFLNPVGTAQCAQGAEGVLLQDDAPHEPTAVVQLFESVPKGDFLESLLDGETADEKFVSRILKLGRLKPNLDLLPCSRIVAPAIVVPNFRSKTPQVDAAGAPGNADTCDAGEGPLSQASGMELCGYTMSHTE